MKLDKMALPLCKAFESLPSKSLLGNYCREVLQQDLARRLVTATPALLVGDSRLGYERVSCWGRDGIATNVPKIWGAKLLRCA